MTSAVGKTLPIDKRHAANSLNLDILARTVVRIEVVERRCRLVEDQVTSLKDLFQAQWGASRQLMGSILSIQNELDEAKREATTSNFENDKFSGLQAANLLTEKIQHLENQLREESFCHAALADKLAEKDALIEIMMLDLKMPLQERDALNHHLQTHTTKLEKTLMVALQVEHDLKAAQAESCSTCKSNSLLLLSAGASQTSPSDVHKGLLQLIAELTKSYRECKTLLGSRNMPQASNISSESDFPLENTKTHSQLDLLEEHFSQSTLNDQLDAAVNERDRLKRLLFQQPFQRLLQLQSDRVHLLRHADLLGSQIDHGNVSELFQQLCESQSEHEKISIDLEKTRSECERLHEQLSESVKHLQESDTRISELELSLSQAVHCCMKHMQERDARISELEVSVSQTEKNKIPTIGSDQISSLLLDLKIALSECEKLHQQLSMKHLQEHGDCIPALEDSFSHPAKRNPLVKDSTPTPSIVVPALVSDKRQTIRTETVQYLGKPVRVLADDEDFADGIDSTSRIYPSERDVSKSIDESKLQWRVESSAELQVNKASEREKEFESVQQRVLDLEPMERSALKRLVHVEKELQKSKAHCQKLERANQELKSLLLETQDSLDATQDSLDATQRKNKTSPKRPDTQGKSQTPPKGVNTPISDFIFPSSSDADTHLASLNSLFQIQWGTSEEQSGLIAELVAELQCQLRDAQSAETKLRADLIETQVCCRKEIEHCERQMADLQRYVSDLPSHRLIQTDTGTVESARDSSQSQEEILHYTHQVMMCAVNTLDDERAKGAAARAGTERNRRQLLRIHAELTRLVAETFQHLETIQLSLPQRFEDIAASATHFRRFCVTVDKSSVFDQLDNDQTNETHDISTHTHTQFGSPSSPPLRSPTTQGLATSDATTSRRRGVESPVARVRRGVQSPLNANTNTSRGDTNTSKEEPKSAESSLISGEQGPYDEAMSIISHLSTLYSHICKVMIDQKKKSSPNDTFRRTGQTRLPNTGSNGNTSVMSDFIGTGAPSALNATAANLAGVANQRMALEAEVRALRKERREERKARARLVEELEHATLDRERLSVEIEELRRDLHMSDAFASETGLLSLRGAPGDRALSPLRLAAVQRQQTPPRLRSRSPH